MHTGNVKSGSVWNGNRVTLGAAECNTVWDSDIQWDIQAFVRPVVSKKGKVWRNCKFRVPVAHFRQSVLIRIKKG